MVLFNTKALLKTILFFVIVLPLAGGFTYLCEYHGTYVFVVIFCLVVLGIFLVGVYKTYQMFAEESEEEACPYCTCDKYKDHCPIHPDDPHNL